MLSIAFSPLSLEQKAFPVGSTVRVTVGFKYTAGASQAVELKAGPYYTNILGSHMVDVCVGSAELNLPPASSPTDETAMVDFPLVPQAQGGIEDGTYGLRVWIEGTSAEAFQDNLIIVSGNPGAAPDMLSSMLPMLMMFLMLGMVMPLMQGGGEK